MSKTIKIPGRLESAETGKVVAGANAILDDTKGKKQNVINEETDAELLRLDQEKQGNLTFDQTPTEDSTNPVTSGGVYAADKMLSQAIEAILLLIPSAASELNKLVDLATMNSSISTATASFKGTYNLVSDLHLTVSATHAQIAAALDALSLGADNNDYAFVQVPNTDTAPTDIAKTERYKFNGENWAYEYDLNNSGFTTAQWNAINSGITTLLVAKLSALPTNEALTLALAGKQDNLTFDNVPTAGSNNPVKSSGIYTRNNEIVALINALDVAKQNVLTFDTTPTNGSTNPVTSNGVYLAIQLVQTAVVALDGRMGTAETRISTAEGNIVNLQAAYAALTQSDIVVVEGVLPSSGQQQNVIYRQPDQDHTPPQFYSDYMWNGTVWVLMATYNNAIDPRPKKGSQNLVTSGGVFDNMGALDVSELNATENPHTLKPYATLDAALADIPSDYQKGGMSIKYVQTSDNKYLQYRLMANTWSTNVSDWQGVDTEVTPNSENLIESGAVLNALKNGGAISLNKCFINGVINDSTGEIVAGNSKRLVFPFRIKGKYLSKLNVDQTNSTIKFWIGLYIYSSGSDVPTWSAYQKTDKFSWNFDADKEYNLLARNSTDTNVSPSDLKDVYFSVYSEIENREEEEFNENVVERLDKNEFDIKNLSVMTENKDIKSLIINAVIDDNTGEITNYGYSKRAVFEDKLSGDIISFLNINQEQSTQKIYVGLYTYASEDAVPVWSSFRTTDSIIIPFEKGKYYNILIRTAEDSAFDVSDLADISFGFEFRRDSEILNLHPYDKEAEVVSSIARGFHNDSSSPFDVNPLVLMWCSDLHRNVENEKRLLAFKDRYATYLDDAIHTGDLVNFYGDDVATYVNTPFCENFLLCLGDHEYYDHEEGSTWVLASQSDVYNKYIAPFKSNWSGCIFPESGVSYYYKDYTAKKVRLIVLDFEDYSPSSAQATWLSERLAETLDGSENSAAGFHVVIAVHRTPFRTVMNAKNPFNSFEFNVADGGTVSSDISAKVNTYIEQSGSHFACYLTGHQHIDHFGVGVQYGNQLNITVGTGDDVAGSNTQDIARIKGTDSQDLFNIIAVDTYNSTIRLARVGAKYDRYGREKKTLCYYYGNEAFDPSESYTRAKIVEYDSKLYMFTSNHSGVWTGDDVVEIDRLMYC